MPEAYLDSGELVCSAFSPVRFTPGAPSAAGNGLTYRKPGGTICGRDRVDPAEIYFPDGSDWGAPRHAPLMSLDAHALSYGLAGPQARSPLEALSAHTGGQLALSETNGSDDGRTYSADPEIAATQDSYQGREEYAAQHVATAWLALVVGQLDAPMIDSSTYPVPLVDPDARPAPPSQLRSP